MFHRRKCPKVMYWDEETERKETGLSGIRKPFLYIDRGIYYIDEPSITFKYTNK